MIGNQIQDCIMTLYPKEWMITEISRDKMLSYDLAQVK